MHYKLFLIIMLFMLLTVSPVMAQSMDAESSDSAIMSITPVPQEYVLPYPGMLSDSPLFFLKEIRDGIISFLIADTVKKADFNLLQSDKSLQNGIALLGKKKSALAFKSFALEETYFSQAITLLEKAKKQQQDTKELLQKASQSGIKHQDVLEDTAATLSGEDKKKLRIHEEKITKLTEKVTSLASK